MGFFSPCYSRGGLFIFCIVCIVFLFCLSLLVSYRTSSLPYVVSVPSCTNKILLLVYFLLSLLSEYTGSTSPDRCRDTYMNTYFTHIVQVTALMEFYHQGLQTMVQHSIMDCFLGMARGPYQTRRTTSTKEEEKKYKYIYNIAMYRGVLVP